MGQMDKLVDYTDEWSAEIEVKRGRKILVNTNGRGYADDNKIIADTGRVLKIELKASSPEALADKVGIILGTIESEGE